MGRGFNFATCLEGALVRHILRKPKIWFGRTLRSVQCRKDGVGSFCSLSLICPMCWGFPYAKHFTTYEACDVVGDGCIPDSTTKNNASPIIYQRDGMSVDFLIDRQPVLIVHSVHGRDIWAGVPSTCSTITWRFSRSNSQISNLSSVVSFGVQSTGGPSQPFSKHTRPWLQTTFVEICQTVKPKTFLWSLFCLVENQGNHVHAQWRDHGGRIETWSSCFDRPRHAGTNDRS